MDEPKMKEEPQEVGVPPPAPTRQRASQKRGAEPSSQGPKKKKGRKTPRMPAPAYLVQETDNDMLLIISNVSGGASEWPVWRAPKAKKKKKKKRKPLKGLKKPVAKRGKPVKQGPVAAGVLGETSRKALPPKTRPGPGGFWGEHLPVEILVRIFQHAVASDGSVPFLCRVARVCRLWYGAASNPTLWQKVSLGYCWAPSGRKQSPAVQKKVLSTVEWLAGSRFSHLRHFTLCHWKSHVPFVLQEIGKCCPLLGSLKLSHCRGVTTDALRALADCCPQLESLNLQNSQLDSSAVVSFLEAAGFRIRHLWLTYSSRMSAILALLVSGCCPGLQLLEVNTEIHQSSQHFELPIELLQVACPQLQVLRLLNFILSPKSRPCSAPPSQGFTQLQELCLATSFHSFVDDSTLQRILWASSRLRVLDLRGCFRVTPRGLETLPCLDVEQLYLGLYCSATHLNLPLEGCPRMTWKWRHSLRELDLTGQSFSEHDLQQAMVAFTCAGGKGEEPPLCSLNATGTKMALGTVSTLIASCPALSYLNLSSCRHLPRGMKKAYRGCDEIRQCLHQLLIRAEEPVSSGAAP